MNIITLLRDYSVPYELYGKNVSRNWVGVLCPYCNDRSFHGGIPLNGSKVYTCFRCGTHDFLKTLSLLLKKSVHETKEILENYDLYSGKPVIEEQTYAKTLDLIGDENLHTGAVQYLIKRNFDPKYLALKYKIRSTSYENEAWKYRIIIPIYDNHTIISFVGRDYTNKQIPRYKMLPLNQSLANPKHFLYNEQFMKNTEQIGVCEGAFDAMRLGDGFVATLGTKVTPQQISKLLIYDRIYLVFDPEPKAQEIANDIAVKLSSFGKEAIVINTELDHDPADMTSDEVRMLRKALFFKG